MADLPAQDCNCLVTPATCVVWIRSSKYCTPCAHEVMIREWSNDYWPEHATCTCRSSLCIREGGFIIILKWTYDGKRMVMMCRRFDLVRLITISRLRDTNMAVDSSPGSLLLRKVWEPHNALLTGLSHPPHLPALFGWRLRVPRLQLADESHHEKWGCSHSCMRQTSLRKTIPFWFFLVGAH